MQVKTIKWRSLFGRMIDYFLLFLGLGMVTSFLPYFIDSQAYLLLTLCIPALMVPIEALCLHYLGTTPGKALLGVAVKTQGKEKLSLKEAFKQALFLKSRAGVVETKPLSLTRRLSSLFVGVGCIVMSFFGNTLSQWMVGLGKGVATTEGWVEYNSDNGFTVQLPAEPSEEHHVIKIPEANKNLDYHALKSYQNKHVQYAVNLLDLPSRWKMAGASKLLKTALDAVVAFNPGAQVVGKRFTTHQGYRALDFVMKQGNQEVRGRIILVGSRLYELSIAYPADISLDFSDNHFMDSFDVKK